jgi:predicted RND superfamily exporter protein
MHLRFVTAIVDFASRRPFLVLLLAALVFAGLCVPAHAIEVRSDLTELLPKDSPGFKAFEHQAGRAGGAATLIVIVSSPDRADNEAFVDDLAVRLEELAKAKPDIVAYVESGTKDVRSFYEKNKWLYADLGELEKIDEDLDHQIAIRSGAVSDLLDDEPAPAPAAAPTEKKEALGLSDALSKWESEASRKDSFPTGYFESPVGKLVGVRIAANTSLGGAGGDALLADVQAIVASMAKPAGMEIGFTGDIASAAGEKKALVSEAIGATLLAVAVILLAIAVYFRSAWALVVIAAPVALGVVAAYAFARLAFGYVNTAGAFLGAIIVGNGINYPIVLLARYQELRARGTPPDEARREAVLRALRVELLGACVAAIAYGSLVVTRFRGFRQFGAIGFVGMLLVWASIVPLVPALVAAIERVEPYLPRILRWRVPSARGSALARLAARAATAKPRAILTGAMLLALLALAKVPGWIGDPWEYDFGKLGSRSSDVSGAGEWSNKANVVFGGKMNIAGAQMIADTPEQVPLLKAQILANDARDPKGKMIAEITTIDDALPGPRADQEEKLAVLDRIRSRLTPYVVSTLTPEEKRTADRARPPEDLRVLVPSDLPGLVRRRFTERSGIVGTVFYVKPNNDVVFADGHNHLRLSATTDNVHLPDGTVVQTASRSTIFAEMLSSLRRDGPLVSAVSLGAVVVVVLVLSRARNVAVGTLAALLLGVVGLFGFAAWSGARLNYVNFIALPITFGIGCEYPFNIADRVRVLGGDVRAAIERSGGAVMLCSFTTIVGYGSLMLSDFQALESFGKLAVAGEVASSLAALVVLPAFFTWRGGRA